ncbi:hypothetical protein V491_07552 [Pseudogymnoascus sp. VKM F-3775]|nr:hypothetical protein V491_07552 [Pseudogymnoascus sp. VKM F-3775]
MVNRYQRRNSRPHACHSFMNNYGPPHHPRPLIHQPPIPTHDGRFIPSTVFSPDHYFQGINSTFAERAYLLSCLQQEDIRVTALLTVIADLNARMASGAQMRAREAKWLRRDLAAKRYEVDMSSRQEKLILQRLGEVTLVIQQRERWSMVEREKGMGVGVGVGAGAAMRVDIGMSGNAWGGWNGPDVVSSNGQQIMREGQPQGHYDCLGWGQQFPAPGYVMITPPASTEGGGISGCNDWQLPASVDSSSDWDMSRNSSVDAMEQKPARVGRSDSMVELAAGRPRAQRRMSMPDLGSKPRGGDYPRYLGYYSPGCSLELADGSDN